MKYNRKPVAGYVVALLFAGLAVSCTKDQFPEASLPTPDAADLQIKAIDEGNYHGEIVPLELAKLVTRKPEFQQLYGGIDSAKGAKGARIATRDKVIRDAVSLRDNHNQPALHVINYQNGGFVVLSAERSPEPVLAFFDTDQFQTTQLPNGVNEWVEDNQKAMELIRTQSATARSARIASGNSLAGMQWNNVLALTGLRQTINYSGTSG